MDAQVLQQPRRTTLAILTHQDKTRIFRGNLDNFIDLIRTGKEHHVDVYVMTTKSFNLSEKHAVGYTYNTASKSWKKKRMPLPHVIYNRIPYRKFELLPEVQQVIQTCLRHSQIRFFNPSFFNKWTLFEWLNQSAATRAIIPATQKLTSSEDLEKLLQAHSFLYLKPIRGKAGKGIMRLTKLASKDGSEEPRPYELSVQSKSKSLIYRYPSVSQLWPHIQQMMGNKEYIAQQGIPLAKFRQRPFDLRVLVQKNGKGLWTVAGVGARRAGKHSITTHVPRGGSIDNPAKLLLSAFGPLDARRIMARVRKTALLAAKQIEQACGHQLGEMSMDLGVDVNGNIWFFEANSKPMKFDEPLIRRRSLNNLIRYSIYLSRSKRGKARSIRRLQGDGRRVTAENRRL